MQWKHDKRPKAGKKPEKVETEPMRKDMELELDETPQHGSFPIVCCHCSRPHIMREEEVKMFDGGRKISHVDCYKEDDAPQVEPTKEGQE